MTGIEGEVVGGYLLRKRAVSQQQRRSSGGSQGSAAQLLSLQSPRRDSLEHRRSDCVESDHLQHTSSSSLDVVRGDDHPKNAAPEESKYIAKDQIEYEHCGSQMIDDKQWLEREDQLQKDVERLTFELQECQAKIERISQEKLALETSAQVYAEQSANSISALRALLSPRNVPNDGKTSSSRSSQMGPRRLSQTASSPLNRDETVPDTLQSVTVTVAKLYQSIQERLDQETRERKRLHNLVADLKGSIRVFCRVKPSDQENLSVQSNVLDQSITIQCPRPGAKQNQEEASKSFKFDAVFGPHDLQESVFQQTSPLIASAMDGYSVCIFAYGQTGTGKTFTMEGGQDTERGVSYRALAEVFRIAHARQADCSSDIHLSMTEVYMEKIRDLLSDHEEATLEVKQGPHGSFLPGLTQVRVVGMEQAWTYLRKGQRARKSAATTMNQDSSRSHCLLQLHISATSKISGERWKSSLWLCDLAGSERVAKSGAVGESLKEAQFINKSLSALGDCINALARKAPHVPFRNSKLTHMLQDSLSGNGKMLMIVTIAQEAENASESLYSLQFASRIRGIELGPSKRNIDVGESTKALKAEIGTLQAQLAASEASRRAQLAEMKAIKAAGSNKCHLAAQNRPVLQPLPFSRYGGSVVQHPYTQSERPATQTLDLGLQAGTSKTRSAAWVPQSAWKSKRRQEPHRPVWQSKAASGNTEKGALINYPKKSLWGLRTAHASAKENAAPEQNSGMHPAHAADSRRVVPQEEAAAARAYRKLHYGQTGLSATRVKQVEMLQHASMLQKPERTPAVWRRKPLHD